MLGTKEMALKKTLEKWQKEINQMIKKLNVVLTSAKGEKDLENNKTEKACLDNLKKLKKEIENEIKQHECEIWIE